MSASAFCRMLALGFMVVVWLPPAGVPAPSRTPSAPSRAAAEAIEGTWSFGGGAVLVTATGPTTFVGVVTQATTFDICKHPVGQRMWEIRGSGSSYTGTHVGFHNADCSPYPGFRATWDVSETSSSFTARFCWFAPEGNSACSTLERLKPPTQAPSTTTTRTVTTPTTLETTPATTRTVPFYRAYQFFPRTVYDTPITRSYSKARGTLTLPGSGKPACLIQVRGLKIGGLYSVYQDTDGSTRGRVATAGPWTRVGTFRGRRGVSTFRCPSAPPRGTSLYIGIEPSHRTILISGNIP